MADQDLVQAEVPTGTNAQHSNDVAVERNPHWRTQYDLTQIAAERGFPLEEFTQRCAAFFELSEGVRYAAFHQITIQQVIDDPMIRYCVHRHLHHDPSTAVRKYALHLTKSALETVRPESELHESLLGDVFNSLFDRIRAIQKSVIHYFERNPELLSLPLLVNHTRSTYQSSEALSAIGDALVTRTPGPIDEPLSRVEVTKLVLSCVDNPNLNLSDPAHLHLELNLRRLLNPTSEFREQDPSLRMILVEGMAPLLNRPNIFVYYVLSLGSGYPHVDQLLLDKLDDYCLQLENGSGLELHPTDRLQVLDKLQPLAQNNGQPEGSASENSIKAARVLKFIEGISA